MKNLQKLEIQLRLNNGNNGYFDYYNSYFESMAGFYNKLENEAEEGGIMIIVSVENGVVKCDVSPASADLRNQE